MATLNLSTNGATITRSYQSIVDAVPPAGSAGQSGTYGQWAVFSVSAPLVNAFQQDSGKESVLKVQSTGEGELVDLIDEFSDGKIQFAFVKVKDPNTTLAKSVLIGWCGEGVPERTKGYFTSHLAAVSRLLHGYHVQITARTDSDLTPEGIVRKVADSSGSRYSGDNASSVTDARQAPPIASKPVFTPTQVGGSSTAFNPLGSRTRAAPPPPTNVDEDGWGEDAPQVTRTQLEKVAPAYQPTKVNMRELTSQQREPSRVQAPPEPSNGQADVVKGVYQPVGKVDIAAIRREAQQTGSAQDDRPTVVKGSYEPVGKVDIAAIRARAQPAAEAPPAAVSPVTTGETGGPKSLAERSAAFTEPERLTSLPKPKVANRFGSGASTFTGTKAPVPGGFEAKSIASTAPVGVAGKNFADEGGKTPAQIWAEKKARERGNSGAADTAPFAGSTVPIASQTSGGSQWSAGYTGKKWGPVQTTTTGRSAASATSQERADEPGDDFEEAPPTGGVSAIRDRFKGAAPMGAPTTSVVLADEDRGPPSPPRMDMSSKPNAGVRIPGLAEAQEDEPYEEPARSPSPEPSGSPIRVAQPVGRGPVAPEPEYEEEAPPMPSRSMAQMALDEDDIDDEPAVQASDPARGASIAAAQSNFGTQPVAAAPPPASGDGERAVAQYDYEKAEENEIDLNENEIITDIKMLSEDWWQGRNSKGETGLFPANYVELVGEDDAADEPAPTQPVAAATLAAAPAKAGHTAIAQYEYDAGEDNEISFPEGATITSIEFPDEDWWLGEFGGKKGYFPSNYVELKT